MKNLLVVEPQSYLDFISLMSNSRLVITDSGGIQEETTVLGVPCLTIRNETERLITVRDGTNTLVGTRKNSIVEETMKVIEGVEKKGGIQRLWDGKTAKRIVEVIIGKLPQ